MFRMFGRRISSKACYTTVISVFILSWCFWLIYFVSFSSWRWTFEKVLTEAEGFGRYQIALFFLLVLPRLTLPCHFLLNNFIAATPPHHCDISSLDSGGETLSQEQRLTISIPKEEDGTFNSCHMFLKPQFYLLTNSSNATEPPMVPCQSGWVYDSSTFKSTVVTQVISGTFWVRSVRWGNVLHMFVSFQFDLVCNTKGLTRASATVFFIGVMLGAVFFGVLCDK